MSHTNINQEGAGIAKLITGKVDLTAKKIAKDKERHYTNIRGPTKQEVVILNVYVPSNRAARYMK